MSDVAPITTPSRRRFLGSAAASAAGLAVAAASLRPQRAEAAPTYTDVDILNFALNLEYLEAEYYLHGVYGAGLGASMTSGTGTQGTVVSKSATPYVTFTTPGLQQMMEEIADDEQDHVVFLRAALGAEAVAEPNINIGTAFTSLGVAAGLGPSFDPYASELNFLLGGMIFEDVGVTAYHGAASLISNKTYLSAAAGILAVEGYHSSELRTMLAQRAQSDSSINTTVQAISNLRNTLDGKADDDQGILLNGSINIVPTDYYGIVFARNFMQVLSIVCGQNGAKSGLFFPNGLNGGIK